LGTRVVRETARGHHLVGRSRGEPPYLSIVFPVVPDPSRLAYGFHLLVMGVSTPVSPLVVTPSLAL
jgi:hypothetical protein